MHRLKPHHTPTQCVHLMGPSATKSWCGRATRRWLKSGPRTNLPVSNLIDHVTCSHCLRAWEDAE